MSATDTNTKALNAAKVQIQGSLTGIESKLQAEQAEISQTLNDFEKYNRERERAIAANKGAQDNLCSDIFGAIKKACPDLELDEREVESLVTMYENFVKAGGKKFNDFITSYGKNHKWLALFTGDPANSDTVKEINGMFTKYSDANSAFKKIMELTEKIDGLLLPFNSGNRYFSSSTK